MRRVICRMSTGTAPATSEMNQQLKQVLDKMPADCAYRVRVQEALPELNEQEVKSELMVARMVLQERSWLSRPDERPVADQWTSAFK